LCGSASWIAGIVHMLLSDLSMPETLEHGAIAFLYRPRVETPVARGIEDVQRFFLVLAPDGGRRLRRVCVGRKRLPDAGRHERFWGYVDRVAGSAAELVADIGPGRYWTRTRGLRHQPGPRLAGQGAYAVARHGDHVHLGYVLGRPGRGGEVQDELRIAPEASYVVAVLAREGERRFVPLEPAALDEPGTELVLIGTGEDVAAQLGVRLDPEREAGEIESLLDAVRGGGERPWAGPLFDGLWR
jgi:hypothetical protein